MEGGGSFSLLLFFSYPLETGSRGTVANFPRGLALQKVVPLTEDVILGAFRLLRLLGFLLTLQGLLVGGG